MKRFLVLLVAAMLMAPFAAKASDIEEFELGGTAPTMSKEGMPSAGAETVKPAAAQKKLPAKTVAMEPKKGSEAKPAAKAKDSSEEPVRYSSSALYDGREGHFRVGLVGPGFGVANRGMGPMMTMGLDGEYFFWEHLSAGMRIEVATKFKDTTILSFVPQARYVFDFDSHPRWSAYVQGGVGLALINGKHPAADIVIPGGGFSWQWTQRWSVGAESNFHILARSEVVVEWTIAPTFRYQF